METLARKIINKATDGGYNIYTLPTITFLQKHAEVVSVSELSFLDNDHIKYECMWKDSFGEVVDGEDHIHVRILFSQHDFAKAFFGKRWKKNLMEMVLEEDWVNYIIDYV